MARTRDGHDVAIRVVAIKNEGHEHLSILRKVATGPITLLSNNHVLPMFTEFHFHDIAFGIFPMVGWMMSDVYDYWAKNSVGDMVDMLMQALEANKPLVQTKIIMRSSSAPRSLSLWMRMQKSSPQSPTGGSSPRNRDISWLHPFTPN